MQRIRWQGMQETIDKIKGLLAGLGTPVSSGTPIDAGVLARVDGARVPYTLNEGWDIPIANLCDESWGTFNIRLMRHISNMGLEGDNLRQVLEEVQLDDSHWEWLRKAIAKRGDEYRWFFLLAEDQPQAACLIYHPKPSAASQAVQIFYIDYLAVAPWNRRNPMAPQAFKGLGRMMVDRVSTYAKTHLNLSPGMCLHSLPKATAFYESLGMIRFPQLDKDGLAYFELCPTPGNTPTGGA